MKLSLPTVAGLDAITIPSPCPVSWGSMQGDARVRFCAQCGQHVYNLSEMRAAEAVRLIEGHEGRLCVQLFRRADGTVLTADCPIGWRLRIWKRLRRHVAWAASVFAMAFLPGAGCPGGGNMRMPDRIYVPQPDAGKNPPTTNPPSVGDPMPKPVSDTAAGAR
jgi:hypothetical protein